ncbi:MAG: chromosome segregation protein SMC [Clostridia bacterium]|nr:chromosome segregation protein SMC [Clostridia bacterium]
MKLVKLEINGFKSFARKTEIEFENGITAIIGPNGSGKSNIADAVRWVLGEQSARALRGSKMEDIIFNGTEQKKPLAYCEVSLTFDNTDGKLNTEYTEVTVTRRVYRSGESEYLLNRTNCRLKDIGEVFRDTGIGKEGYSIIGQGRVEEILSNKSSERRNVFEEAAGVMKYRVRKEEAERKLENTRKNLQRLGDILEELGNQVGPLEEQSAAAREYLRLRDELKEIEINVFLYQYDKLNERLRTLGETLSQLASEIETGAALESSLGADCAAEEERERALSGVISELQNELLQLTSAVEAKSGESRVFRERMENLLKDRERLQSRRAENETASRALMESIAALEKNIAENAGSLDAERENFRLQSEKLAAMAAEIGEKEENLERQKREMIEAMNRIADAKSMLSRFEAIRGTLEQRLLSIDDEEAALREKAAGLEAEYAAAKQQFDAVETMRSDAAAKRAAAINALNETNERMRQAREAVRTMEQQTEAGKSRLKVLEEMKRAHEGYYASVRNVLRDSARDMELKKRIEGVVAELLRVPKEYETAVEMALGAALQNIVTPTEQDAKYVIEYLRRREYGRATLLPISAMRPRVLDGTERDACRVDGFIGIGSELVGYDAKYRGVAENLLGRTVIVRDLDAGIAINKRAKGAFRIATLKGDIINPGGAMTGGSVQKREFSLIGREREIEELKKRMLSLAEQLQVKNDEAAAAEASLDGANAAVAAAAEMLHKKDVELATQREKLDIIKKYVDESREALEEAALERTQIRDNIEDIDAQRQEAEEAREGLEEGNFATQEDIRRSQQALAELRNAHAAENETATEQRVSLMALEKERGAAQSELSRMQRELARIGADVEADAKAAEESLRKFEAMQEELKGMDVDISAEREEVNAHTDRLHAMEEERAKHLLALDELRARRESISADLSDMRERRHRAELNENRAEMELKTMQDRIWEDYELTYENALPFRRQIAITASHMKVDELKKAIRALGDVNVSAIEDYKNVKERFESLSTQCADLTKAEADLQTLIAELVTTMEAEFRKQFDRIGENFTTTFTELFGGGKAELILSDEKDILNCDIDIIAQPPGKKLQLLSLLSGGERALTAIALLFAILKLKPTAFCILDEIESSLDEVNVSNFAEYVKRYSENTQFILITHRKGSMEVCNALYGVAMEEKGISKIVSARFNEIA